MSNPAIDILEAEIERSEKELVKLEREVDFAAGALERANTVKNLQEEYIQELLAAVAILKGE